MATGIKQRGNLALVYLWLNDSLSSNFAAQTVSLNLSNYDAVLIEFNTTKSDTNNRGSMICLKNGAKHILFSANTGETTYRTRGATVSDSGVTFTAGYQGTTSNNQNIIPYKIFGIMGLEQ